MDDLKKLEMQGWQALSSAGEAGREFYRTVLHDDAVMVFPGGMLLAGKAKILASFAAQPWQSFRIENLRLIALSETAAVVIYRVTAQREGYEPYLALISSTYTRVDRAWKLVLHQQTPI